MNTAKIGRTVQWGISDLCLHRAPTFRYFSTASFGFLYGLFDAMRKEG